MSAAASRAEDGKICARWKCASCIESDSYLCLSIRTGLEPEILDTLVEDNYDDLPCGYRLCIASQVYNILPHNSDIEPILERRWCDDEAN